MSLLTDVDKQKTFNDLLESEGVELLNFLPFTESLQQLQQEIYAGLSTSPRCLSSKFFYDDEGSRLFEAITHLEEYYLSRAEKEILSSIGSQLSVDYKHLTIVDLGSGDASKISLLLGQIPNHLLNSIHYVPVDISPSALENAMVELAQTFGIKKITGVIADIFYQLDVLPLTGKRLFCFFGSTIGNMDMRQVKLFMESLSKNMKAGDSLLLGMDMVKDVGTLERAYNDKKGLTARFNKNILHNVNAIMGSHFNPEDFDHLAFFNTAESRIEMHLKAKNAMTIHLASLGKKIEIAKDELIHTENSHKFTPAMIEEIGAYGALLLQEVYRDGKGYFSLAHYVKP